MPTDDGWTVRERLPNGAELLSIRREFGGSRWRARIGDVEVGYFSGTSPTYSQAVGWVYDPELATNPPWVESLGCYAPASVTNYAMVQGEDAPCKTFEDWRAAIAQVRLVAEGQLEFPELTS